MDLTIIWTSSIYIQREHVVRQNLRKRERERGGGRRAVKLAGLTHLSPARLDPWNKYPQAKFYQPSPFKTNPQS